MYVYARYRRLTALVAPSPAKDKPLTEDRARQLAVRLRQRYPLAGLKFWQQAEPNPRAAEAWVELRGIIDKALRHPTVETPLRGSPVLSEREACAYLDLPHDRLRHEVNTGRLSFSGTKRKRRFATSELDRWRGQTEH